MHFSVITQRAVKIDRSFLYLLLLKKSIYSVFLTSFYLALVNAQVFL